ncbi:hypothetical protein K0M31_002480, partial [Melipona bicolor]
MIRNQNSQILHKPKPKPLPTRQKLFLVPLVINWLLLLLGSKVKDEEGKKRSPFRELRSTDSKSFNLQ